MNNQQRIDRAIELFSTIYLGGIPPIITNDSAFLSFICALAATEALAGFRYATLEPKPGKRFNLFVQQYFPREYHRHTANNELWIFRCRMFHAFSPAGFTLIHHHSEKHFETNRETRKPILNAEDFYAAVLTAAQAYFQELRTNPQLQDYFVARLDNKEDGGSIDVGPISTSPSVTGEPRTEGATTYQGPPGAST